MTTLRSRLKKLVPANALKILRVARQRWVPKTRRDLRIFGETIRYGQHPVYRHEYFPESTRKTWLDVPEWEENVRLKAESGEISAADAEACRAFAREGYFIAERLIEPEQAKAAFAAYDEALRSGRITFNPGDKRYLDPHVAVPEVDALFRHPAIQRYNDLFIGAKTIPFQTIGSHYGSQQLDHSDAIHMTTHPLGYMVAAWIACEDVHEDSGPLRYYPGSHRLPYALSLEAGIKPLEFLRAGNYSVYNEKYEPTIGKIVKDSGLKPLHFNARNGDVLFWHHNLIHGGSPIRDDSKTRNAFVCHYFCGEAFCYHDLSGNAARLAAPEA